MNDSNAITSPDSPWWAKLLDRFGIPTVFLAIVLYWVYASSQWLAEHVVVPVTNGHIRLLESVQKTSAKLTEQSVAQTKVLRELQQTNAAILDQAKKNGETTRKALAIQPAQVLEAVERIEKKIDQQ